MDDLDRRLAVLSQQAELDDAALAVALTEEWDDVADSSANEFTIMVCSL